MNIPRYVRRDFRQILLCTRISSNTDNPKCVASSKNEVRATVFCEIFRHKQSEADKTKMAAAHVVLFYPYNQCFPNVLSVKKCSSGS